MGPDHIKEFYRASGSNLGGVKVDQLFIEHLQILFGKQNISQIQTENLDEWLKIIEDFERGKKIVNSKSIEDSVLLTTSKACPWDREHFKKVSNSTKKGVELMKNGNLVVFTKVIAKMIARVASQIAEHVTDILKEVDLKDLDAILLVGGFANSPIIKEEMKNLVGEKIRLIVPENSELCVVKGAVMFAWKRDIISLRKSRYTYGFSIDKKFIEGEHDESKGYRDDVNGVKWCRNYFDKLVTINDDLPIEKCIENITLHPYSGTRTVSRLFCTEDPDPKYSDIDGVKLIGEIEIPNAKEKHGKKIIKHVYFGDTEIYLKITDETTGETYEETFDFLSAVRDVKLLE